MSRLMAMDWLAGSHACALWIGNNRTHSFKPWTKAQSAYWPKQLLMFRLGCMHIE